MSAFSVLAEVNDNLSPDDAPVWAEVLGNVLALGVTARSMCHICIALLTDHCPELADYDVAAAASVASLRDAPAHVDLAARLLSLAAGIVAWGLLVPAVGASTVAEPTRLLVELYLIANLTVLLIDPALFAWARWTDNDRT